MPEIICLGEFLIDMISTDFDVSLEEAGGYVRAPGGAPANVAVGIARLRRKSGFIGCVGKDHFGKFLYHCMEKEGVNTSLLYLTEKARTSLAFIGVRKDQTKEIIFYRNPGADMFLSTKEIKLDYIKQAKILHFGSISLIDELPRLATLKAIKYARQKGITISYDPNYRSSLWISPTIARKRIRSVIKYVDVVKISEEEWGFITGNVNFTTGSKDFFAAGVKLLVISRGIEGAYFATPQFEEYVPGFKVNVVETTGAGDAFVAALLTKLLSIIEKGKNISVITKKELHNIIEWANAAGALACTKPGAIPALPYLLDVEKFLLSKK